MADFDPAPKYKYSPDGKTVTWVNRDHMPKVAAQAGDEPMLPSHPDPHTYSWSAREVEAIRKYGAACRASGAAKVSQRATADAEPDEIVEANREGWWDGMQDAQQLLADEICKAARYDWLVEQLGGSISIDLDCSKGEIAEIIDAEIERATTKPGA